jgi:hypothetical protein
MLRDSLQLAKNKPSPSSSGAKVKRSRDLQGQIGQGGGTMVNQDWASLARHCQNMIAHFDQGAVRT